MTVNDGAKSEAREPPVCSRFLFFFSLFIRSNFIVWCISCQPLSIMKAYSLVWSIRGVSFLFCRLIIYNVGTLTT